MTAAPRRHSAVVFAYHDVGVRCLKVLLAHGVDVRLVVTHTDNPAEHIWFESVAALANDYGLPVIAPTDVNDEATLAAVTACQADFLFSFYYRQMLAPRLLATAPAGAYNLHGSLLPRYRGRVPVNWAVLHGESQTGATLHQMLEKPDRGPIVAQQAVPILPDDTAGEVFRKVVVAAEIALDACLPELLAGRATLREQDQRDASYFGGRKPEDGRIDWSQGAAQIHNLVRAVAPPYPGAYTESTSGTIRLLRTLRLGASSAPERAIAAAAGSPAPSASSAPSTPTAPPGLSAGLFCTQGSLYALAADGDLLRILHAELDGRPLDAALFTERFGACLSFDPPAPREPAS